MHSRRAAPLTLAILMAVAAVAILLVAKDFGSAWDDAVQQEYGRRALAFYMTGGQDRSANELLDLKYYGPLVEMLIAAVTRFFPEQHVFMRHLLAALLALLGAPALYRLGRMLGSRWIGVGAAVFLMLMPQFCGHAFVNTKDIPFAVGIAASMSLLASMFIRGRFSYREILWTGLTIGLTLAVRPGGALILGAYYAALATFTDWQNWRRAVGFASSIPRPRARTLGKQFVLLATAWLVMILPWPWAWESPLVHPLQAIRMASKFHLVMPVLFEGRYFASNDLPRHYLARLVLMTMPPATLILAAFGMFAGGAQLLRKPLSRRSRLLVILLAWPMLPLILFALLRPNAYDGMRHFLFIVPPLALWAAFGCWSLFKRAATSEICRVGLVASLIAVSTVQTTTLVRWHPYQATYYNLLAGQSGVERTFETDYWLLSYKEAIKWIASQPRVASTADRPIRVLLAANEHARACAANFAGPGIEIACTLDAAQPGDLPPGYDYYIGTTRGGMAYNFPDAPVAHLIERPGFALTAIRRAASGSAD
jgi:hypothetical protein